MTPPPGMRPAPIAAALMLGAAVSGSALATLPPQTGRVDLATQANVVITGGPAGDRAGWSVGGAGDVNGDGLADIVIGAPQASPAGRAQAGTVYVVFGSRTRTRVDLSSLGEAGFRILGDVAGGSAGLSVDGAGDVNGDGLADIVIGAPGFLAPGRAYVVFGGRSGSDVDLAYIGARGFVMSGTAVDMLGYSVAGAGDMTGDGLADLVIGAPYASGTDGRAYLVWGSRSAVDIPDITALGARGTFLQGTSGASAGTAVGGDMDMNGDGYSDAVVGAPFGCAVAGCVFVVPGGPGGTPAASPFAIQAPYQLGNAVAGAGDMNGDGLGDAVLGTSFASGGAGTADVVLGSRTVPGNLDISTPGPWGFSITGAAGDDLGWSVQPAGDVNGDGLADIITGAPDPLSGVGMAYAVYGSRSPASADVVGMPPRAGFVAVGAAPGDKTGWSASGAGDVNGDGRDDIVVSAPWAASQAGETYVVFGFGQPQVSYGPGVTGTAGSAITPVSPTTRTTGPATFTVSPPLPSGLSLDASTGVVSGTPIASATTTRTVTMTDAAGSATATLRIAVAAAPIVPGRLSVRWAVSGRRMTSSARRVAGARSYRLVARSGSLRRVGRCGAPGTSTTRITCTVTLAPGWWTLTESAMAGTTVLATASRRVVIARHRAPAVTG